MSAMKLILLVFVLCLCASANFDVWVGAVRHNLNNNPTCEQSTAKLLELIQATLADNPNLDVLVTPEYSLAGPFGFEPCHDAEFTIGYNKGTYSLQPADDPHSQLVNGLIQNAMQLASQHETYIQLVVMEKITLDPNNYPILYSKSVENGQGGEARMESSILIGKDGDIVDSTRRNDYYLQSGFCALPDGTYDADCVGEANMLDFERLDPIILEIHGKKFPVFSTICGALCSECESPGPAYYCVNTCYDEDEMANYYARLHLHPAAEGQYYAEATEYLYNGTCGSNDPQSCEYFIGSFVSNWRSEYIDERHIEVSNSYFIVSDNVGGQAGVINANRNPPKELSITGQYVVAKIGISECNEGWSCIDGKNKQYVNSGCEVTQRAYCPYGCSMGACQNKPSLRPAVYTTAMARAQGSVSVLAIVVLVAGCSYIFIRREF